MSTGNTPRVSSNRRTRESDSAKYHIKMTTRPGTLFSSFRNAVRYVSMNLSPIRHRDELTLTASRPWIELAVQIAGSFSPLLVRLVGGLLSSHIIFHTESFILNYLCRSAELYQTQTS